MGTQAKPPKPPKKEFSNFTIEELDAAIKGNYPAGLVEKVRKNNWCLVWSLS